MESSLAFQLSKMLKDCEEREAVLVEALKLVKEREAVVAATKEAQEKRGAELTAEAARYQDFRDIATERRSLEDMSRKLKAAEVQILDERSRLSRERQEGTEMLRMEKEEISGAKERIAARDAELKNAENVLKDEKIRHHDLVVRELAMIESRRMGVK